VCRHIFDHTASLYERRWNNYAKQETSKKGQEGCQETRSQEEDRKARKETTINLPKLSAAVRASESQQKIPLMLVEGFLFTKITTITTVALSSFGLSSLSFLHLKKLPRAHRYRHIQPSHSAARRAPVEYLRRYAA